MFLRLRRRIQPAPRSLWAEFSVLLSSGQRYGVYRRPGRFNLAGVALVHGRAPELRLVMSSSGVMQIGARVSF